MSHVGIDLEQFATDPQGSGIQRVLQQLALHWPSDETPADFVVPYAGRFLVLSPMQAGGLVSSVFTEAGQVDPRGVIARHIEELAEQAPLVDAGRLIAMYDSWLLPEVSYLPSVQERFRIFHKAMHTCMIGYDVLPMSDPSNYRFRPGQAAQVSEYFRLLTMSDAVVCISDSTREEIWRRLRRDRRLRIDVAHPGGDHQEHAFGGEINRPASDRVRFLRVGTLEARKQPTQLLHAFRHAVASGMRAELIFIGSPSASDAHINVALLDAAASGIGVQWIEQASDADVLEHMRRADIFLSVGTEGYGIPVLEALALGTPVLFDGVQPAAEIMSGFGASRFTQQGSDDASWADAFAFYAVRDHAQALRAAIDVTRIPTWSSFASSVASASRNG